MYLLCEAGRSVPLDQYPFPMMYQHEPTQPTVSMPRLIVSVSESSTQVLERNHDMRLVGWVVQATMFPAELDMLVGLLGFTQHPESLLHTV
tara:strand:- start:548 stop:820 length:273 start_codon:yes stop_codon:yes gene_type:complete